MNVAPRVNKPDPTTERSLLTSIDSSVVFRNDVDKNVKINSRNRNCYQSSPSLHQINNIPNNNAVGLEREFGFGLESLEDDRI